ncbi:OFA family MFS transporter [Pectinatus brassicae]|uniref:OFA family oxalate/formate antiporter-like MFS transporter n=1 Tax=Pectinatus brassicae TaxID=862415 RepID=A0A840UTJ7_9FIRM|nr:OFA family MFS transporter [Pectinatus brassicae]MBB5336144.1 OFA family oxalate/formate antiporter-like MFS transporter [Pectinatus brassicae]
MRNRWLIALSAIGIHICIGSVYAWSVLTKPIMQQMGFSLKETTWTFSLAILFLGLSAGFLGSFVEKCGPKKSGLLSMLFFVIGMFGTAFALSMHSLVLLYVFYGIIGGIGLGIGYITPVSTLVKYFPKRRGFATGLAIMGFGFASLIAGPLMQYLTSHYGLAVNFIILGCAYMIVMSASAMYLKAPENDNTGKNNKSITYKYKGMTAQEALKTWQFSALWWVFFINITCGIGLLAVASPMAQDVVKMTPVAAASMVGIIGLLNGFGRIFWSTISDFIGRGYTYALFFLIEIAAFWQLAQVSTVFAFESLVFLIITCYGGGFSCMPAYLSDVFGTKQLSAIHGRILTAWGIAGVVGPVAVSWLREATNSYSLTLYAFSACFVLNLIIALILKNKGKKLEFN